MSCLLTTGRAVGCRDGIGGLKAAYITELANKATLTSATEGLISAFTLATGKQFWTLELIKETSSFKDVLTVNKQNGTVYSAQEINLIFNKGDVASRNLVKLIAQNPCMIILLDKTGTYWLSGEISGCDLETSEFASGTAMGDRNGYTLKFTAQEPNQMQSVTSSLISALLSPAS